ncbi:MAG: SDR family NAD(P)-dependent oxidoreductase [Pseudomonadota bacterium]|nr:SDR family NAD(P)-dependent oxidoreductase [Pseudomonadota bacterium]
MTAGQSRPGKLSDIGEWFYSPSWTRCPWISRSADGANNGSGRAWLVFTDGSEFSARLVERIKAQGYDPSVVKLGKRYHRDGDRGFTIDPRSPRDYFLLTEDLHRAGTVPETILHLWCHSPSITDAASAPTIDTWQSLGFYSLVYLSQALDKISVTKPIKISVVTSQAQEVLTGDTLIPAKAMVHGPCVVIPQELTNVACQSVDVAAAEVGNWNTQKLDALLADVATESSGNVVAYRGNHRWTRTYSPLPLAPTNAKPTLLRQRGIYLITGGLGGVGLLLAEYLARTVQAKLVLTGRSEVPPRSQWSEWLASPDYDERITEKLKAISALEEMGAEVFVASADVADPQAMRRVIHDTQLRFGKINGFIHAAGIVNGPTDGAILDLDKENCAQIFCPKVEGLLNLASLAQEADLDFCFLTSSLSSVLGGLGFSAYAAANVFMNAFAYTQNQTQSVPWLSVNWDAWLTEQDSDIPLRVAGMSSQEGLETFDRILSLGQAGQTVVSISPLEARIDQWVKMDRSRDRPLKQESQIFSQTHGDQEQLTTENAAGNQATQIITEVWKELLGLKTVGIHDDFFELGGDSLLGMEIVARIKRAGIPLTPKHIIEHPTIAQLATVASAPETEVAEQGEVAGPVHITPAMHRFLYERGSPYVHRWNLATLLETKQRIDLPYLELAAKHLLNHHDALRLRLSESEGIWQANNLGFGNNSFVSMVDISDLSAEEQKKAIEAHSENVQASFNLTYGPMLNLTLFDLGIEQAQKLFFAAHHFILEGLSWTVFWHDLETSYLQLSSGQEIFFPAKTYSFKEWSQALREYARSAELREELSYWLDLPWSAVRCLPTDFPETRKHNTNNSAQEVCATFTEAETDSLLYGSKKSDPEVILATALAQSLADWTGSETVLFDQYRHGRDALPAGIDTSHTTGFFISHNPLVIDLSEAHSPEVRLATVQKQFQAVPNKGYGYDLLRCLSGDPGISDKLNSIPRSEVLFNYRGRLTDIFADSTLFTLSSELSGSVDDPRGISITATHDPHGIRYYPISISADIVNRRLIVKFVYSKNLHSLSTVIELRDAFSESLRTMSGCHEKQPVRLIRTVVK